MRNQEELEQIIEAANSKEPTGMRLRELITAWKASGPNLQKLMYADQRLGRILRGACRVGYRPTASGKADLELLIDPMAFDLEYHKEIAKHFHRRPPEEGLASMRAEQEAVRLFVSLTLSPDCEKLDGPCVRCQRYYIRKRTKQKCCSRTCGNVIRNTARNRDKRKQAHDASLKKARAAVLKYRNHPDWKKRAARAAGRTVKWITRAVNKSGGLTNFLGRRKRT
jgi:hypothetical protein